METTCYTTTPPLFLPRLHANLSHVSTLETLAYCQKDRRLTTCPPSAHHEARLGGADLAATRQEKEVATIHLMQHSRAHGPEDSSGRPGGSRLADVSSLTCIVPKPPCPPLLPLSSLPVGYNKSPRHAKFSHVDLSFFFSFSFSPQGGLADRLTRTRHPSALEPTFRTTHT